MKLGVDLGGTKIEIIAIDDSGKELYKKRVNTPQSNYSATLQCIKDLVLSTEYELAQSGSVGVGTPGSVSPSNGLLRGSNSTCLNQKPFKQDLQNLLKREIQISNDANCFALSEAIDGAAQDTQTVFGVIVGTGCGAGLVINKQVIDGPNSITGEWGHNPLPWPEENELLSTQCWCGKNGCIETFLSGPGFENDYAQTTRQEKDSREIVSLSEEGDEAANQVLARYELRMAKSLAHIINIIDPHIIVLGGGMSNIDRLYENVPKLWQTYVFSETVLTKLAPPKYGDASGVRGAAWLWK
ncbi:MAG: ROK family protein [Pseudomonadota bacterium]